MKRPVRVLIVDDSATMRGLISNVLTRDPGIDVVGQAADAHAARQAIKALNPDVITLDVEMPSMNGLDLLEKIMRLRPMPVIMISTLTHSGTETAVRALELGAVDCVPKPDGSGGAPFADLCERVKAAAMARVRAQEPRAATPRPVVHAASGAPPDGRIVAIGSSTGGVEALIVLLSEFPRDCPPTVITQHMPPTFTRSFAKRLDGLCAPSVIEAHDGAPLRVGQILLAPGGEHHMAVVGGGSSLKCTLRAGPTVNGHRPSVDVMFMSLAKVAATRCVGVLLTGMGRDGADGLLALRQAGARTLAQDEQSCVVYGMPKAAKELGAVEMQLPLNRLTAAILARRPAHVEPHL